MSVLRVGVALLVVVAFIVAWVLTRSAAPAYRTSLVRTATVEATLESVGTVTPLNQADLAFNVSGKVGSVDVTMGSAVGQGQTVASLDPTALNASVVSAEATVAAAEATLSAAESSQSAAASAPVTMGTPAPTPTTAPSSRSDQSSNAEQIGQLQATLVSDQMQEDADSSAASQSLGVATGLCEAPAAGGMSAAASTSAPADGTGAPTTCAEALTQATAAQNKVSADIKQVSHDESALTAALEPASTTDSTAATAAPSASATAYVASSTGAASRLAETGPSPSGTTSPPATLVAVGAASRSEPATSQQLAVDQAAIDTAQAQLTDAQQALDDVNLVSPISGTVASVSIGVGDSVSAASGTTDPDVVIIGPGSSYQLVTQVPVAKIAAVTVGQSAVVNPDATNTQLQGTVTAIGVLPSSTSAGTTYPVTIALTSPDLGLFSGADAAATIVVGTSADVTAVPTSAVRTVGSIHLVTVVDNGTTKATRVTLGTVGDVLTQITSGLKPGQLVALANLEQPVPTTSTGIARFGGAGLGGAGLGRIGLGGAGSGGAGLGVGGPGSFGG
jgi:HlyD family secretion protein